MKHLGKIHINFLLFAVLIGFAGFGQTEAIFYKLTGKDVSPHSITYAVKQDSIGNIWIGTEEGLLKYDSNKFKVYTSYKGLPGMVSNRVRQILIDSKQRIWLGLEKGICLYNKNLDRFELLGDKNQINPAYVLTIAEGQDNSIWFGGFNGLWQYSDSLGLKQFAQAYRINALLAYKNMIFFGSPKGLFTFDKNTGKIEKIDLLTDQEIKSLSIINGRVLAGSNTGDIFEIDPLSLTAKKLDIKTSIKKPVFDMVSDLNQNIYIATDGQGLYKFDQNFKLRNHFTENPNDPKSLSSNGIYDLEIGKENILWIATYGGGINYLKLDPIPIINIKHQINNPNSIASDFTRAISVDKTGKIWFGTKKGISIFNPESKTWKHLQLNGNNNKSSTIVLTIEPDDNYMWIGTYGNGLYRIDIKDYNRLKHSNSFLPDLSLSKIYALLKDSRDNLWVGGIEGKLNIVRSNNKLDTYPITDVKTIVEGKDGKVIIGSRDGVYIINDSLHQFEHIQGLLPGNKLAYSKVNSIYETNNGDLIIATNGAGLIFYDLNEKSKQILNVAKGLPSDIVLGILPVDDRNIWVSTTEGLAHIVIKDNDTLIHKFDKIDGLASTEYNFGSYAKLNDTTFAFGGVDGVSLFNPKKIKQHASKPNIVFDVFKLFNKTIQPGTEPLQQHINQVNKIKLKHSQNSFEIKFAGISHANPTQVKYSWKLEGFDTDWTKPDNTNFVTYTNLNPGTYIFKVKALNKYGVAGPERQLILEIKTPWWKTPLALFIYGLLILGLIFSIIHFTSVIVNKKHTDEQIEFFNNITHEIKTPLAVLISTLDNITNKTDSDEQTKKRIKTTVNRIKSLFEQMLNFQRITSAKDFTEDIHKINLENLINQIVNNFKPLIKKRNLQIEVINDWGDESLYFNKEVLQKILQNLISNAIKYSFDNGKIIIKAVKTNQGELQIEVIDEGLGIPKDQQKYILNRYYRARNVINSQRPGTGLGLLMVKKLIDKTGGNIKFESQENKGSRFTVVLKNFIKKYKQHAITKEDEIHQLRNDLEDQTELDNFSDAKILIVEDNDDLRETLAKALSYYFQVYEATNGKEGLEIAGQIHPDIILTDLIMPEMDGMQMAEAIKKDINLNHIPIFMLSVLSSPDYKLKSAETGILSYIEKPIDMKYLLAKMLNTLKQQKKLREKYKHESDIDNAALYRSKNDREFIKKLEQIILDNIENSGFSVHDLSESVGMSRTSLYMKLKNLVDLSPQDFIIHTKLRLAKKLLIEGNMSIKEVAYSSGFSNPKYFSTVFKKFYKMSPRKFLESLKDK